MKLSKYRFIIKPQRELILPPYKGSTFRGGFGNAFRHAVCMDREKECANCALRQKCVYSYVFETPNPVKAKKTEESKDENVPHPFIIEPALDEGQYYGKDDELEFHLILIGRAVDYIPYFIYAFEELGRTGIGRNKGKYSLERVVSLDKDREILIYDGDSHFRDDCLVIDSSELVREAEELNCHTAALRFLTPTRIKYQGKLIIDMDFGILMRNLLRRLSWLAEVHCDEKWELDWKGLIQRAAVVKTVHSDLQWRDWERYSQRQGTRMKMGGFVGEMRFEGDLAEFNPFLKIGEFLHIGKGTVYGLGKYEILSGEADQLAGRALRGLSSFNEKISDFISK
ncbi:MAG: CRISPR system precrRNA processing endoribonuclease RAMP protein Cas6 [Candidatus Methanoperedens sp.]|nr:CRISPR system precrRNA processing endoribonuclease RAMP protein Cas6 [Candidatus Methanoperedens sp.]